MKHKVYKKRLTQNQVRGLIGVVSRIGRVQGDKCALLMSLYFAERIFARLREATYGLRTHYTLSLTPPEAAAFYTLFSGMEVDAQDWASVIAMEICLGIDQQLQLTATQAAPKTETKNAPVS